MGLKTLQLWNVIWIWPTTLKNMGKKKKQKFYTINALRISIKKMHKWKSMTKKMILMGHLIVLRIYLRSLKFNNRGFLEVLIWVSKREMRVLYRGLEYIIDRSKTMIELVMCLRGCSRSEKSSFCQGNKNRMTESMKDCQIFKCL